MKPWQREGFFDDGDEKRQHFVPRSSILNRFLEPDEWQDLPNRAQHLRQLDKSSGEIGWRGPKVAAQRLKLNAHGGMSTEKYWGEDDRALAAGAQELAKGNLDGAFMMVPALACLPLRGPSWISDMERLAIEAGESNPRWYARGGAAVIADRVKRDWLTALDRGLVEITVEEIPTEVSARFIIGDVPASVQVEETGQGLHIVNRPGWIWEEEFFPEDGDPEPGDPSRLHLQVPIASRFHMTAVIRNNAEEYSSACFVEVAKDRAKAVNQEQFERAVEHAWAGHRRDLKTAQDAQV